MTLTTEQSAVWEQLCSLPKQSLALALKHEPEDTSWEAPGIYVIWDGNDAVYIGCALMTRPHESKAKRLWGLKDRLDSHQRGQISGSSLALAAWFCRIAPTLSPEQHQAIRELKLNPSSLTEDFIKKLTFSCLPVLEAGKIEAALYRNKRPPFNEFQEFVRKDRLLRLKKSKKLD